jgi:hypothetical protein
VGVVVVAREKVLCSSERVNSGARFISRGGYVGPVRGAEVVARKRIAVEPRREAVRKRGRMR